MSFLPVRAALTALALAGALSLSACGAADDIKDKTDKVAQFPAQVESNFVTSCVDSGGDQATCQCTFDEIEKSMSIDEFAKIEDSIDGTTLPPEFEAAIRSCMK